jgi:small-conductance mechanosensitive channel
MALSALDYALWAAGFFGQAALFAILIIRRRWREFPVFTTVMGFETVVGPALYLLVQYGSSSLYKEVYWSSVLIEFALQLGIILEIARIVLRPTGTWVRDAKKQFIFWGALGILIAAALPFLVTPPAATLLHRLEVRGDLFTSLVICELIAVVTRTSKNLGLGWRNHVMALGNGWTAWAVAAILVDGLHSYFGAERYFAELEHTRMVVYLAVLGYWTVQFWLEEPARQPISPQLSAYIQELHRRVKNDLDTLGVQR